MNEKALKVGVDVIELELDLSVSRLIVVSGRDRKGRRLERHLKITDKQGVVLV